MDYVYKPPTDAPWESIEDVGTRSRLQNFVKGLKDGQCTPSIVNMVLKDFVAPEWRARVFAEAGVPDPSAPEDDGEILDLGDDGVITDDDDELGFAALHAPPKKVEPVVVVESKAPLSKAVKVEKVQTASTPLLEDVDDDELFPVSKRHDDDDDLHEPPVSITVVESSKKKKKKKKKDKHESGGRDKDPLNVPMQVTAAASYGATYSNPPSNVEDLLQPRMGSKKEFTATNMYHVGLYADHNTFKGEPLWVLFLLAVFTNIDIGVVLPTLFSVMALQYNDISYGFTIAGFGIGQLMAGPIVRAWGERPLREVLLVSSLVSAAGHWIYILLGQQDSWEFLLIGRVVAGMGSAYIFIAGLSITRLSPRGPSTRKRLDWFRMLTLSARLFGALLGLLLEQVSPIPPYSFVLGDKTIIISPFNGGIFILACAFTLMFFIQAFYFGCASSRAPRDYGFLDADGEDERASVDLGAPSSSPAPINSWSGFWLTTLYGATVLGYWLGATMFFPYVAARGGWGLKEQYILASVALAAGWAASFIQPYHMRFLATPSLGQGPGTIFMPDKADTSSSLAISSGLSLGTLLGTPAANYQTVKLGLSFMVFGSLSLFSFFNREIYPEQMYVSFGFLTAGYTLVMSMIVAVVNDRRVAATQYPGSLLSLPTANPLFGFLLATSGVSQVAAPVFGALVMGNSVNEAFELVRVVLLGLALVGLFSHGFGNNDV